MDEKEAIEILKDENQEIFDFRTGKVNEKWSKAYKKVIQTAEKLYKENTDLKELYIRTAKHQEKMGHLELAEYMLAQIQAIPTFTTWEEYTTWVSKDDIRKILDKYKNKEIDYAPELYKEIKNLLEGN